jgi:spore germination cell wall hydrolase CwlJ-like protein
MRYFIFVLILLSTTLSTADAKTKHRNARTAAPADAAVCMAQAIYHEAGHEIRQGQIAVGNVIMNRVKTNGYADNVCSVVYERCQFAFTCRGQKQIDWTTNNHLIELSKQIIAGKYEDYSRGAISFNNRPFKSRGLIKTTKIGNHYFYRNYANLGNAKDI